MEKLENNPSIWYTIGLNIIFLSPDRRYVELAEFQTGHWTKLKKNQDFKSLRDF